MDLILRPLVCLKSSIFDNLLMANQGVCLLSLNLLSTLKSQPKTKALLQLCMSSGILLAPSLADHAQTRMVAGQE